MAYDTWGGSWGASWAASWTKVASTTPSAPVVIGGAGPSAKGRRRRVFVRIDGENFEVSTDAEAVALLTEARAQAEVAAKAQAERALAKAERNKRATLAPPKVPKIELVREPGVDVTAIAFQQLQAQIEAATAAITDTYQRVWAEVDARRRQEADDEEAILFLIG